MIGREEKVLIVNCWSDDVEIMDQLKFSGATYTYELSHNEYLHLYCQDRRNRRLHFQLPS